MHDVLKPHEDRLFLIVDDDAYSAQFFRRRMNVVATDKINVYLDLFESPKRGLSAIQNLVAPSSDQPQGRVIDMVIVDLKATSEANLKFVRKAAPLLQPASVPLVVFISGVDQTLATTLIEAGAAECFVRHAELDRYDAELTRIIALSRRWSKAA